MWRAVRTFILTILALAVLAVLALATPPGRAILAGFIENAASTNGLSVTITGMSGWPPFSAGADQIVIADPDGAFAVIDGLDADLRVWPLLTGNLAIRSLNAERVAILRRPNLPQGNGGSAALLPFAAERFTITELDLGPDLAGTAAVLAAEGSAIVAPAGAVTVRLAAERIDGEQGTLTASIDRAAAAAPLAVTIDLREGQNGILLGLMGRSEGPAYALTASTGLTGDVLDGNLSLVSDGSARFDGRFSLSPSGDGQRLVLEGSGNLAELVPPEYAALLDGQIDVNVDADWQRVAGDTLPYLTIREGRLSTGSVRATASGTIDGAVANLDVSLEAANPEGGPIAIPFVAALSQIDTVSLTGTVAPSGDAIRLDLVGQVGGLVSGDVRVPNLGVSVAVEAAGGPDPLAGGRLPFALRAEADALQTQTGRIESSGGAPLIFMAEGAWDTATATAEMTARLSAAGGNADFVGTIAAAGLDGRIALDFADLDPLSPIAGRAISGALEATATGTFGANSQFTVEGAAVDLHPGDATLARFFGGVTGFRAAVDHRDGATAITDANIDGIGFDATGGMTLSADAIDATLSGTIADLSQLAERSSGTGTFMALITGTPTRPDVDASITIADGMLAGQRVQSGVIAFRGAPTNEGWAGALTLDGTFAGGPLAGSANVTLDQASGLVSFPTVNLAVGRNTIAGAVERTPDGLLSGTLSVDAPEVQNLAALALMNATGAARAEVRLTPQDGGQTVGVSFTGRDVSYANASLGAVEGEAIIDDAFGTPLVRGNATASAMTIGGLRIDRAQADAAVDGGVTRFTATAHGPDVNLTGRGSLAGGSGSPTLRIDALNGTAFRFPVALNQSVTIALDETEPRISGATLSLGGGTVRIDGAVSPALDLTVVASNVAASVANSFVPGLGAEGILSGRATVTGQPAQPAIAWTATWNGLRTASTASAGLPALSLTTRGNATRTATSIDANLSGAGLALTIAGQAPFAGAGLNVTAVGTAPLALLAAQSDRELRLAGTARVNLSITGTIVAPATSGTIDLADAVMADTETGFGVTGASGRIDFNGRTATIRQIAGRMLQGGEIVVAGTVDVTGAALPAALTVRVTNGRYSDGRTVNTTFNANLEINGPLLGGGVVSGAVGLGRTEIQLPDRIGSTAAIEVRHINAPPGFVPPEPRLRPSGATAGAPTRSGGGGLGLNITLTAPAGVFVRGFGIDSELGESLRVGGTTASPQAAGGLQMRRGRIEVIGRRFDFTRGQLTFAGDLMPYVDFAATTRSADATVTLNVLGPANDPDIHFTSVPDMPEEEIISRLLFQRSVSALSPLQALQLVDAVAQLTGAVGQGGILGRIRAATGLDDLDIQQTATGGTTVGVGRRISENLRVGVQAGTEAGSGRVVIDLDLTPNLKAQAEAGQDGSGKVGVTYEREY